MTNFSMFTSYAQFTAMRLAMQEGADDWSWMNWYEVLEAYYLNNGLYEVLAETLAQANIDTKLKGLVNPAHRAVEFYVGKLWPGKLPDALPIVADKKAIIEPIHQVWQWSNWTSEKQLAARWFAMYGDLFIKVAHKQPKNGESSPTKVVFQLLNPKHVTEMKTDLQGYVIYIRMDVPILDPVPGAAPRPMLYTEVWDKAADTYRTWKHTRTHLTAVAALGQPQVEKSITRDFRVDFIPIVWQPWVRLDDSRGLGVYAPFLDKMDDANKLASRLRQLLFRYDRPVWALMAGHVDNSGRPMPAPKLAGDHLLLGDDDTIVPLPGNSKLESLVPNINYDAALRTLESAIAQLEKDLPELQYYNLVDKGELSGRALRLLLGPAIDRVIEARGNGEAALERANAIALTLGQEWGIFEKSIGSYADGDFNHSFAERDVIALPRIEEAETTQVYVTAGVPLITALRREGWTEDELKQLEKDLEKQQEHTNQNLAASILNAQRTLDGAGSLGLENPSLPVSGGLNGGRATGGVEGSESLPATDS